MPADLEYPHATFFLSNLKIPILSVTYHHDAMIIQEAFV